MGNLKVGDYVVIKSQKWYQENKSPGGYVSSDKYLDEMFSSFNAEYCSKVFHITKIHEHLRANDVYILDIPEIEYDVYWNDWMFDSFKYGDILRVTFKSGVIQTLIFDNWDNSELISYIVAIYDKILSNQVLTNRRIFMRTVATIEHCSDEEKKQFLNDIEDKKIFWSESNKLLEDLR